MGMAILWTMKSFYSESNLQIYLIYRPYLL